MAGTPYPGGHMQTIPATGLGAWKRALSRVRTASASLVSTHARLTFSSFSACTTSSLGGRAWMWYAGMAGVHKRDFYRAPEGTTVPPAVSF